MNEVFVKLVNMSVAAGWLILAVLVLRLALKKAPRWITCLLWALVAVRLPSLTSWEDVTGAVRQMISANFDSTIPICSSAIEHPSLLRLHAVVSTIRLHEVV